MTPKKLLFFSVAFVLSLGLFACLPDKANQTNDPLGTGSIQGGTDFGNPKVGGSDFGNPEVGGSDFGNPGQQGGSDFGNPSVDFKGEAPGVAGADPHACKGEMEKCPGTKTWVRCKFDTIKATDVESSEIVVAPIEVMDVSPPRCSFKISLPAGHTFSMACVNEGAVEDVVFADGATTITVTEGHDLVDLGWICGGVEEKGEESRREESPRTQDREGVIDTVSGRYEAGGILDLFSTCPIFSGDSLEFIDLGFIGPRENNALSMFTTLNCPSRLRGTSPILKEGSLTGAYSSSQDFLLKGSQQSCDNKDWQISCRVMGKQLSQDGIFSASCELTLAGEADQLCSIINYTQEGEGSGTEEERDSIPPLLMHKKEPGVPGVPGVRKMYLKKPGVRKMYLKEPGVRKMYLKED